GHVHHFYVKPTHRGQGFGGLLDDYARETLRRAGSVRARLNVTARNARAIRFYLAQGWEDIGAPPGSALRFMQVAL
ncbi:MAG: GNAT family N-acetyltransferase, partial [Hyphococcus sp.]